MKKKYFLYLQENIAQREQLLKYKEELSRLSNQLFDLNSQIEKLETILRERDNAYNNIVNSTSWKVLMLLGRIRLRLFPNNSKMGRLYDKIIKR